MESLTADVTRFDRELHVADYHGDIGGVRATRVISVCARQIARINGTANGPRWMRRRSRLQQKRDGLHVQ